MKKFDVKDIATGDKNAIFMGARILGYGQEYSFNYKKWNQWKNLQLI